MHHFSSACFQLLLCSSLLGPSASICLYNSGSCTFPVRHKWWYLSFLCSVWKSVWVYDEVSLSPGSDEDWYFALIIQSIRFLGLLICIKVVWSNKFQNESPHYSHPSTVFCDKLDSTELHRNQPLELVFGSYLLLDLYLKMFPSRLCGSWLTMWTKSPRSFWKLALFSLCLRSSFFWLW